MKSDLKIFKGLYGDDSISSINDFISHEPLEARSKMYNWEINEHLHTDLVQIFIIESGNGILLSERNQLMLQKYSLVLIPSNFLHGFTFESNIIGDVITISESLFENLFKTNQNIFNEINKLSLYDFSEDKTNFDKIILFKNLIVNELNEEMPEKFYLIQSLFQSIFTCIYRQNLETNLLSTNTDNRTLQYFQHFQKSIRKNLLETKSVKEYADELGISSMHLNRICQAVCHKSPLQILNEKLITEAKKYLLNTSYTISEISYFLNFNDPAYFTRLFKKSVGVSPSDFRRV